MNPKPIAIFCSDIHLSVKPPALRFNEPDWYEAMERPIKELCKLQSKLKVPILCCGDVFDHWRSPPELVNFAIQTLPKMYAIPGQHDLPNHSYEDIERSAYWTLTEADIVRHIEPGKPVRLEDEGLELWGFPWGFNPEPCLSDWTRRGESSLKIAIVHQYCWSGKHKYPTAPEQNNVRSFKLTGYDAVAFGDNHDGFIRGRICNCGSMMRRHSPDLQRHPFLSVLMSDMSFKQHILDTSNDVYSTDSEDEVAEVGSIDIASFTDGLLELKDARDLDFGKVLQRYCQKMKVSSRVISIINQAVDSER